MQVVATGVGYDGLCIRNIGDEFPMPAGSSGSWFKPVEAVTEAAAEVVEVESEVVEQPEAVYADLQDKPKRKYNRRG